MKKESETKQGISWNWGTGIFLVYALFVCGILLMVTGAFRQKVDLESPDYYAKELAFQEQIEKTNRSKALSEPVQIISEKDNIVLHFPFEGGEIKGQVELFRPSDAASDQKFPIKTSLDGSMQIPTLGFKPGAYRLKVDWEFKGITYYDEQVLMIQPPQ